MPASSYCSKCGAQLVPEAQYCTRCGQPTGLVTSSNIHPIAAPSSSPSQPIKRKSKAPLIGCGCLTAFVIVSILAPVFDRAAKNAEEAEEKRVQLKVEIEKNERDIQNSIDKIAESERYVPKLEVQSWKFSQASESYVQVVGEVKNIFSKSLNHVLIVASFYDKKGELITSDDALIDYQPILPNQTSPFKVLTTDNPAMSSVRVNFKEYSGGTIVFRFKEPQK